MVVAAGWFLIAHRLGAAGSIAPVLVVALNVLMAIPYAASILIPAVRAAAQRHDRLAASLGMSRARAPAPDRCSNAERQASLALGLAALVSLGDLGVIAIFGGDGLVTLPLLLYQRLGSYRTADAAALASLLTRADMALTWLLPRGTGQDDTP